MLESLIPFVAPVLTIAGVVIANQLTYGRNTKEKLWELRRQAYGSIIAELAAAERICGVVANMYEENAEKYFQTPLRRENEARIANHIKNTRDVLSANYLVASQPFIDLFEEFALELLTINASDESPPSAHDAITATVRKYRIHLSKIARSEMPFARKGVSVRLPFGRKASSRVVTTSP